MNKRDRAWKDYSERFRRDVLPMLLSSKVCLSIYSGDGSDFDVKQATEIGAALLMGKPLVLISLAGATIPPGLRKAADMVVEDWNPGRPSDQALISEALSEIAGLL